MSPERKIPKKKKPAAKDVSVKNIDDLAIREQLGLIVPIKAVDYLEDYQEAIQTTTTSFGQSIDRLNQLHKKTKGSESASAEKEAMSLILFRPNVALANSQDALEEARKRLGLDEVRDKLFNTLYSAVSLKDGLEMFNREVKKLFGKTYENVKELSQDFPQLTAAELSMLPLLERVPTVYFTHGSAFSHLYEDWDPAWDKLSPATVGADVGGMKFATQDHDYQKQEGPLQTEPYAYLGITGESLNIETVPFNKDIKQVISELVPLVYTNNRLHSHLWYESRGAALGIGFGRVAEKSFLDTFGSKPQRDEYRSFNKTIKELSAGERIEFENNKDKLEESIFKSTIYDLGRDNLMREDEVFVLLGLIERVPDIFDKEKPFSGYIQPYGPGVKFLDSDGNLVDYSVYNPHFLRQSFYGIYWESVQIDKTNSTFRQVFDGLEDHAQAKVLTDAIEIGAELSPLEEIKVDLQLGIGINLAVLPKNNTRELRALYQVIAYGLDSSGFVNKTNSKITLEEAVEIKNVIGLVPKELTTKVSSIKKEVDSGLPLANYLSNMRTLGTYNVSTQEIILRSTGYLIPENIKEEERLGRNFTLTHEIGESIWSQLPEDQKKQYEDISWSEKIREEDEDKHFLTFYAKYAGARDDFCDHFASYVLHAGEFREKAQENEPIAKKYQFIKGMFGRFTGEEKEYPQIATRTIEQVHGNLDQFVKELDLQMAVGKQEKDIADEFNKARSDIKKVAKNIDELERRREKRIEQEELEDEDETERAFNVDEEMEHEDDELVASLPTPWQELAFDVKEILGQFLNEETSGRVSGNIMDLFGEKKFGRIEKKLRAVMSGDDAEEAIDDLKELYMTHEDRLQRSQDE